VDKDYTNDYVYYKVPVPWLQVKLLRLLQYFPPTGMYIGPAIVFVDVLHKTKMNKQMTADLAMMNKLSKILQNVIRNSEEAPKHVQHNNAQNSILFEAINLTIHLDPESSLMDQELVLLGNYISSKETNVRYLGLETMCHLAGAGSRNCIDALRVHKETVVASLRDKDISVRRRALDLLYSMCDQTNAREIVAELLQYLIIADYAIREEMVLKIAILTEKYAMEYSWYVDVVLQLITIAGDHVFDDIWYRVIQIIVNNEELQQYAVKTLLNALKMPSCHETTVKVASYILGEFGHLIANSTGCYPIDQFTALHSKFAICSMPTRAMLMTTYLKFVNLFPEIKDEVVSVFKANKNVLNVELQQRASEYLAITSMQTDDLLQTICEEMPAFPDRESALLARLRKKIDDTEDKRTWVIGGRDANLDIVRIRQRGAGGSARKSKNDDILPSQIERARYRADEVKKSILPVEQEENEGEGKGAARNGGDDDDDDEDFAELKKAMDTTKYLPTPMTSAAPAEVVVDDTTLYNRLMINSNGLLHRDPILEVGVKSEYRGNQGRLALFFGNRSPLVSLSDLSTNIETEPGVGINLIQAIPSSLPAGTQFHQIYSIECLGPFKNPPSITVTYKIGNAQEENHNINTTTTPSTLAMNLPISLTKFVSPVELSAEDFYQKWKQIGGGAPRGESQTTFKGVAGAIVTDSMESRKVLEGLRLGMIDGVDPSPLNVVAAGIFNSAELGKVGCMVRLEINVEHQVSEWCLSLFIFYF
jgi:AP-2 complex subunit alpha